MNFRFPSDSPASIARRELALKRERTVAAKTTRGSVFEAYLREIGHPAAKVPSIDFSKDVPDGHVKLEFAVKEIVPAQPDALKPGDLVMVRDKEIRVWVRRIFKSFEGDKCRTKSWNQAQGHIDNPVHWNFWRLPTPAEQAEYARASGGWTEWKGGECPVAKGTLVQLRFQSGVEHKEAIPALQSFLARAKDWAHENYFGMSQYNIIAYRVVAK